MLTTLVFFHRARWWERLLGLHRPLRVVLGIRSCGVQLVAWFERGEVQIAQRAPWRDRVRVVGEFILPSAGPNLEELSRAVRGSPDVLSASVLKWMLHRGLLRWDEVEVRRARAVDLLAAVIASRHIAKV